jgi:hypothetical protein
MSSLTDQHARRSPRGERDGDGGRPRRFNLFENCYNPVCALRLRAEALGYGMRSPPARAGADYFFKDHKPSVPVRRIARGARFQQSVDRNLFRSPRGAYNSQECSTLSNRFNLFENCYNPVCALRLRAGVESVMPAPPYGSHHCMRARRPRSQAVQGRVLLWRARNMPERPWAALACILIIKI